MTGPTHKPTSAIHSILSILAMCFDLLFITQHYILYSGSSGREIEGQGSGGAVTGDRARSNVTDEEEDVPRNPDERTPLV